MNGARSGDLGQWKHTGLSINLEACIIEIIINHILLIAVYQYSVRHRCRKEDGEGNRVRRIPPMRC